MTGTESPMPDVGHDGEQIHATRGSRSMPHVDEAPRHTWIQPHTARGAKEDAGEQRNNYEEETFFKPNTSLGADPVAGDRPCTWCGATLRGCLVLHVNSGRPCCDRCRCTEPSAHGHFEEVDQC